MHSVTALPATGRVKFVGRPRAKMWVSITCIAVAVWVSFRYLDVSLVDLLRDLPGFFAFFLENFLPPNYGNIVRYLPFILDTILFAVVGTYLSAVLSFVFGLMMSKRHSPFRRCGHSSWLLHQSFETFLLWSGRHC
jgi:ABC-type phosphate/phosphonate transport system permease subunit